MEKMEEMQAAELARHRVDQGAGGYYAKIMDKDQIIARRAYMRNILRVSFFWCTMSNDAFFQLYGFNFNPHDYPYLYEIARNIVYGE